MRCEKLRCTPALLPGSFPRSKGRPSPDAAFRKHEGDRSSVSLFPADLTMSERSIPESGSVKTRMGGVKLGFAILVMNPFLRSLKSFRLSQNIYPRQFKPNDLMRMINVSVTSS